MKNQNQKSQKKKIKYKATIIGCPEITKVTVLKETECFVTVEFTDWHGETGSNKCAKVSSYESYFDTREEAKLFLINWFESSLKDLKKSYTHNRDIKTSYLDVARKL